MLAPVNSLSHGSAHSLNLRDAASTIAAYKKELALDPSNEGLKAGLEDAKKATAAPRDILGVQRGGAITAGARGGVMVASAEGKIGGGRHRGEDLRGLARRGGSVAVEGRSNGGQCENKREKERD